MVALFMFMIHHELIFAIEVKLECEILFLFYTDIQMFQT